MDPFEHLLRDFVDHITGAWIAMDDRTSPLGELAGEAAALLQFYRERQAARLVDLGIKFIDPPHEEPRLPPKVDSRGDTGWGQHWSDSKHGKPI